MRSASATSSSATALTAARSTASSALEARWEDHLGPSPEDCNYLLGRLCDWINGPDFAVDHNDPDSHFKPIAKALVAHRFLASIHPFADDNGRTARLLASRLRARRHPERDLLHPGEPPQPDHHGEQPGAPAIRSGRAEWDWELPLLCPEGLDGGTGRSGRLGRHRPPTDLGGVPVPGLLPVPGPWRLVPFG